MSVEDVIEKLNKSNKTQITAGLDSVVELIVDGESSVIAIGIDGVRESDIEPEAKWKLTSAQLDELVEGKLSLSRGFTKGDLKPEGSTRAVLALVDLFES